MDLESLETSKLIWECIDKLDESEQQKLLSQKLLCDREPIHRFADIRLGDHLVRKGSTIGWNQYEHHFLCIGFTSKNEPKIVHYFNTAKNASGQIISTGSLGSGQSLGKLGKIQEMTLPDKNFIGSEAELQEKGKEVARVVWPEGFRRYSVEEIVKRAQTRMQENYYNLVKNNCESYVMWCLCGVNITLQVTTAERSLYEVLCAGTRAIAGGIYQGGKTVVKKCAPFVDDFFGLNIVSQITESERVKLAQIFLAEFGLDFGCMLTLVFEFGIAAWDIKNAYKQWNEGNLEIKSHVDFIKTVFDTVMLALARLGGSYAGGLLGVVIAHLVTRFLLVKLTKYPAKGIDTVIVSASNSLNQFNTFVKENIDKMLKKGHLVQTFNVAQIAAD